MEDKVSVIMSAYNEKPEYLKSAVCSIINQSYSNLQIIIVIDNPDNKELVCVLEEYAQKDGRIVLIKNPKNCGLVYSLNRALEVANGKYIARMDADDISDLRRIELQIEFLNKTGTDLISSNVINIDEHNKPIQDATSFPNEHDKITKILKFYDCMVHPSWFGKKAVFDELNGYRNIKSCEDYDFLLRAVIKGYKLGVVKDALLKYRINTSGISLSTRPIQKTSHYIIRKYYRKGKIISLDDYNTYMYSKIGKKKQEKYKRYYLMSAHLKTLSGNRIKYLAYGLYMVLSSAEAREVFCHIMIGKLIR